MCFSWCRPPPPRSFFQTPRKTNQLSASTPAAYLNDQNSHQPKRSHPLGGLCASELYAEKKKRREKVLLVKLILRLKQLFLLIKKKQKKETCHCSMGNVEGENGALCIVRRAWHVVWSVCKGWDEQVFSSLESSLRGGPRFIRGWPSATRRSRLKEKQICRLAKRRSRLTSATSERGHLQILFNVLICDCRQRSVKCKKHPVCVRWSLVRTSPRFISSCHSCSNQLFLCRVWSSVCLLCLLLSNLQPPTVIRLKQTRRKHNTSESHAWSKACRDGATHTARRSVTAEWAGDLSGAVSCNCCKSDLDVCFVGRFNAAVR